MNLLKIPTAFNIDLEFTLAPIGRRMAAYLIDFVIIASYFALVRSIFDDFFEAKTFKKIGLLTTNLDDAQILVGFFLISIPMFFYSLVCEVFMNGQTVGKKLLNIRVISLDGTNPRISQYIIRWFVKFFEYPFIFGFLFYSDVWILLPLTFYIFFMGMFGVVVMAISKKSQRIGDIFSNTAVVNTHTQLNIRDTVFMNINENNYKVDFPNVLKLSDRDINTIKSILTDAKKRSDYDLVNRVANKVEEVLESKSTLYADDFLVKILADYNYLATRNTD